MEDGMENWGWADDGVTENGTETENEENVYDGSRWERSVFEGVFVVAKFYLSKAPDGKMKCISRTLGKFAIIDRNFPGTVVDQEIWVCKIIKEINPSKNKGTFILHPIEQVNIDNVKKIIPGFYDIRPLGRAVSIIPNTDPSDFWMLSSATRKIFSKKYYAVVVPIAYSPKKIKLEGEKPEDLPVR